MTGAKAIVFVTISNHMWLFRRVVGISGCAADVLVFLRSQDFILAATRVYIRLRIGPTIPTRSSGALQQHFCAFCRQKELCSSPQLHAFGILCRQEALVHEEHHIVAQKCLLLGATYYKTQRESATRRPDRMYDSGCQVRHHGMFHAHAARQFIY